jgi:hypothetical protein
MCCFLNRTLHFHRIPYKLPRSFDHIKIFIHGAQWVDEYLDSHVASFGSNSDFGENTNERLFSFGCGREDFRILRTEDTGNSLTRTSKRIGPEPLNNFFLLPKIPHSLNEQPAICRPVAALLLPVLFHWLPVFFHRVPSLLLQGQRNFWETAQPRLQRHQFAQPRNNYVTSLLWLQLPTQLINSLYRLFTCFVFPLCLFDLLESLLW